ncbi:hypothetical protein CR513_21444, partial [Mucuna pruriens]
MYGGIDFIGFSVPKALISDQGSHFYNRVMVMLLEKYGVRNQDGESGLERLEPPLGGCFLGLSFTGRDKALSLLGDQEELEELCLEAYENCWIYKEKVKHFHDNRILRKEFKGSQKVLLFNCRLRLIASKLCSRWDGPFVVTNIFSMVRDEANDRTSKVNGHQLKPYYEGPNLSLNVGKLEVVELIKPVIPEDLPEEIPESLFPNETLILPRSAKSTSNSKHKIGVYLQPLIDEFCFDVDNYDFPAYEIFFGWTTTRKLRCPICMEQNKAFIVKHSHKIINHPYRRNKNSFKKRCVETSHPPPRLSSPDIWKRVAHLPFSYDLQEEEQEIPGYGVQHNWKKTKLSYWNTHLLHHNIDVMHTKRNVFMNVFDTMMDINGRTKDTHKARMDIAEICNRKELELKDIGRVKLFKPKAAYAFSKSQRVAICKWVKELKLPDGYASNLGRCVDVNQGKLHGMKSHDCHVFMQQLLPIAFDSLPKHIWNPLVELSHFFRELTSTTLNVEKLTVMEGNIPMLLCKLEQIFLPTFFDSMEHLPIHLPYEARVGGPVQYRWMYPFERFLHSLKNKVKNKARVEASICEAYLVEETSMFASFYYHDKIEMRRTRIPHNVDSGEGSSSTPPISIFNYLGRPGGKAISYFWTKLTLKLLTYTIYTEFLRELNPTTSDAEIDSDISSTFPA